MHDNKKTIKIDELWQCSINPTRDKSDREYRVRAGGEKPVATAILLSRRPQRVKLLTSEAMIETKSDDYE